MTTTIVNLDETLPAIEPEQHHDFWMHEPLDSPQTRIDALIEDRAEVYSDTAMTLVNSNRTIGTGIAYQMLASRLQWARRQDDAKAALLELQKDFSLMVWEIGETLQDIRFFKDDTTKGINNVR